MSNDKKTVKEWLEELPEPYRTEALENMDEEVASEPRGSLVWALMGAFRWDYSSQGYRYWDKIAETL